MDYGICNLSIVPLRAETSDASEMITQVLYGEHFKILEIRKKWSRIRLAFDGYEGWVDNKQYLKISEEDYSNIDERQLKLSSDLVDVVSTSENQLLSVCFGSNVSATDFFKTSF
jgi:uncharacterized protein YgiM (DUF1202 family)